MRKFSFFFQSILFEFSIGVLSVVVGMIFGLSLWNYCSWNRNLLWLSLLGFFPMFLFFHVLDHLPIRSLQQISDLIRSFYREHLRSMSLTQLLLLSATVGFGEEFLFRGLLQRGVLDIFLRFSIQSVYLDLAVITVGGIFFGLLHAVTKTYAVLAFLISVYLGALFYVTENLLLPVLIHAFHDFVVFCVLRWEDRPKTMNKPPEIGGDQTT